jgi:hypothetical protein
MTEQPDQPDRARPAPTVHASEDDLEALLAGNPVELAYPTETDETAATVVWAPDATNPLDLAAVLALRGDGLNHRVLAPGSDEPFIPQIQVGADTARRDPDRPGTVDVTLTEEGYRMLCGLVQSERRLSSDDVNGTAWADLRRIFPAAQYVRQPASRAQIDGIAAANPGEAASVARGMIADSLPSPEDRDIVVLTPVRVADDRYSVTVVFYHPELGEHAARPLTP